MWSMVRARAARRMRLRQRVDPGVRWRAQAKTWLDVFAEPVDGWTPAAGSADRT
jgi:hypothetical protein